MHQGLTEKLGHDLRCRVGDRILDRSLQVYEYLTTLLDAIHGGSEVIVEENHIRGFLGHVRARNVHGDTKVGALQSWRVIDTITSPATLG
jgi:hypothetical protein